MEVEAPRRRPRYPKLIFAYDTESGGPNIYMNPLVSLGAAVVLVTEPESKKGQLQAQLLRTHRFDCWDGKMDHFDPKTKEWWASLDKKDDTTPAGKTVPVRFIDNFRTSQTAEEAFRKFYEAFKDAYELAKRWGVTFVPVTDCAAFDTARIVYLSCRNLPHHRPIPMFAPSEEQELLDPVDVFQVQAGMVMGGSASFDVSQDSTGVFFEAYERDRVTCSMHPQGWAFGQDHRPDADAAKIALRYVQVLNAQYNQAC